MTLLLTLILLSRPYQPPEQLTEEGCKDQEKKWQEHRRRLVKLSEGLITRQYKAKLDRDIEEVDQIIVVWQRLAPLCDRSRNYCHQYWYEQEVEQLRHQLGEEAWALQELPWFPEQIR